MPRFAGPPWLLFQTQIGRRSMSKAGDVIENPVTGERAVVRIGTEETGGELLVVDLHIRPGGAVMGEHTHPTIQERYTVVRGQVGFRLMGGTIIAESGMSLFVPPDMPHDWWNAGSEEAVIRVEVQPAARFEEMIQNAFGLARDGRVNARGMPNLLQMAVFAREFADVVRFSRPPRVVQRLLFGLLAPLARMLGYHGSYPKYRARGPSDSVSVAPLEAATLANGPAAPLRTER
jgi:quercetin dioxygenase-like cupin family protein